jgi:hypothetical protein
VSVHRNKLFALTPNRVCLFDEFDTAPELTMVRPRGEWSRSGLTALALLPMHKLLALGCDNGTLALCT